MLAPRRRAVPRPSAVRRPPPSQSRVHPSPPAPNAALGQFPSSRASPVAPVINFRAVTAAASNTGYVSFPIQNDAVDWLRDGKEDEAEEQTSCPPSPPRRTRSASRTSSSTSRSCISRQVLCRRLQTRPVTF